MRLLDLEPSFLKLGEEPNTHFLVKSLAEADGLVFVCPQCVKDLGKRAGAHSIICWQPHVPQLESRTGPGRWPFSGNDLVDLTLTPSIQLHSVCNAHFFVRNGEIEFA